jgi:hypothetical protein
MSPEDLRVRISVQMLQNNRFQTKLIQSNRIQRILRCKIPIQSSNNLTVDFSPTYIRVLETQRTDIVQNSGALEFVDRRSRIDCCTGCTGWYVVSFEEQDTNSCTGEAECGKGPDRAATNDDYLCVRYGILSVNDEGRGLLQLRKSYSRY